MSASRSTGAVGWPVGLRHAREGPSGSGEPSMHRESERCSGTRPGGWCWVLFAFLVGCSDGQKQPEATPPLVSAIVAAFAPGLSPPGSHGAVVRVVDPNSSASIGTATVKVNDVALTYVGARGRYEGSVELVAGASALLAVGVNGRTYSASNTQFTEYCTVLSPDAGTVFHSQAPIDIRWTTGGTAGGVVGPFTVGVFDADSVNGPPIWPPDGGPLATPNTQSTTEINATLSGGSLLLVVGRASTVNIGNASAGSLFSLAAACGCDITINPVTMTAIAIQPSTVTLPLSATPLGPLQALGFFADGTYSDLTTQVAWQSSDDLVVQVDPAGYLRTEQMGRATVTARYGTFSASAEVLVGPPKLHSIVIEPSNPPPVVRKGETFQLQGLAVYTDNSTIDMTTMLAWRSSD